MKCFTKHRSISFLGSTLCLSLLGYNLLFQSPVPPPSISDSKLPLVLNLLRQNNIIPQDPILQEDQIGFKFVDPSTQANISTLLSSLANPYYQVQSLQNILKAVRMKNKIVKFINLATKHPYATLQNY